MKSMFKRILAALVVAFAAVPAMAYDGTATGGISGISVDTVGTTYGVRVTIGGVSTMCAGSAYSWAYLSESDPNFKSALSVLMVARSSGWGVTIYSNNVGGFCHIVYVSN